LSREPSERNGRPFGEAPNQVVTPLATNHYTTTDHGSAAITDCTTANHSRATTNHGGPTIAHCPTVTNASCTVHTASADNRARLRSADDDETSDKAEGYDRLPHALSLRAVMSLRECFAITRTKMFAMCREVMASGLRPIRARVFPESVRDGAICDRASVWDRSESDDDPGQ